MSSKRWGAGLKLRKLFLCATLAVLLPACTGVVGGGVLVAAVAIGALTSRCYDYLDVSVLDGQGRKTCAAKVTASNGSEHFELGSCYYAPLTDGVWTLRASLAGERGAVTTVPVEHDHDCARHVQSVQLTLSSRRTPVFARPAAEPASAPLPAAPPAPPSTDPSGEQRATPSGSAQEHERSPLTLRFIAWR